MKGNVTCVCGRTCKSRRGLKAHQRACRTIQDLGLEHQQDLLPPFRLHPRVTLQQRHPPMKILLLQLVEVAVFLRRILIIIVPHDFQELNFRKQKLTGKRQIFTSSFVLVPDQQQWIFQLASPLFNRLFITISLKTSILLKAHS